MEELYVQRKNARMRKKYANTGIWFEATPSMLRGIGESSVMTPRSMIQISNTLDSR